MTTVVPALGQAGLVLGKRGAEAHLLCAPHPYLPEKLSVVQPSGHWGRERTLGLGVLFLQQVTQGHTHDPKDGLRRPALAPGHRKLRRREKAVLPQLLFGQNCRLSEPAWTPPSPGVARRGSAALLGGLLGSGQEPRGRGRSLLVPPFGPAVLEPHLRRRELLRRRASRRGAPTGAGPDGRAGGRGLRSRPLVVGPEPLSHSDQPPLPRPFSPPPPTRGAQGAPPAALRSSELPKFWS